MAPRMPSAIGKSNPAPSFLTLAGARLMVSDLLGYPKPELSSALLMRSRLSRTATSGMPTVMKSRPEPAYMSTSTSIKWASMPYTAAVRVRESAIKYEWDEGGIPRRNRRCVATDYYSNVELWWKQSPKRAGGGRPGRIVRPDAPARKSLTQPTFAFPT